MSAKRDYYEVLGISKSASANEIKSQYRKLALKFHPDRNKSADAQEHFKEISEAYAVLSDTSKRKLYDQHGHAGVDGQYSSEDIFRGAGGNFNDVFNDLFGRRSSGGFDSIFENLFGGGGFGNFGRQRGSDMLHKTSITLEDVLHGKQIELDLQKYVDCPDCNGSGCKPGSSKITCNDCGGQGQVRVSRKMGFSTFVTVQPCRKCKGQGQMFENPCKKCQRGKVKGTKHVSFPLPPGIDNGDYLAMQGEGESIPDGDPGDLHVRVRVEPHKLYRRDGTDLYCDARISMIDATLGTEINVKTLENTEKLKIESGTQPNSILKIKSQGLPSPNSNRRGDLFVHVVVEIPKKLSKQQKNILKEFEES